MAASPNAPTTTRTSPSTKRGRREAERQKGGSTASSSAFRRCNLSLESTSKNCRWRCRAPRRRERGRIGVLGTLALDGFSICR